MKIVLLIFGFTLLLSSCSKPAFDEKAETEAIRAVLHTQEIAWNNGDLDAFMQGYWNSDSLLFIRSRGTDRGWQAALESYQKGYPDRASMGTLRFNLLSIQPLSETHFLIAGRYFLTRRNGNLEGSFTLIFRKIDGKWVAVYDHTS